MKQFSLNRMEVKTRLFASMVAMIVPLSILAAGSLLYLHSSFTSFNRLIEDPLHEMNLVGRIQVNILSGANQFKGEPISQITPEKIARIATQTDRLYQEAVNMAFLHPNQRKAIQASQVEWSKALMAMRGMLDGEAKQHLWQDTPEGKFSAHAANAVHLLDYVYQSATTEVDSLLASAEKARRGFVVTVVILILISLAVATVGGIMLARSILIPLKTLEEGASRLGNGDLGHRIPSQGRDEFARLTGHLTPWRRGFSPRIRRFLIFPYATA